MKSNLRTLVVVLTWKLTRSVKPPPEALVNILFRDLLLVHARREQGGFLFPRNRPLKRRWNNLGIRMVTGPSAATVNGATVACVGVRERNLYLTYLSSY